MYLTTPIYFFKCFDVLINRKNRVYFDYLNALLHHLDETIVLMRYISFTKTEI